MDKDSKIYVAGHRGLAGSAICRKLMAEGYGNIITKTHNELDLTRQLDVESFFKLEKPEYVFLSAAKVGGILANSTYPAEFIYSNIMVQSNIIHSSYLNGIKKLVFLGSSCIYPRDCPQPMKEEHLLSGYLEPTNEPYAVAKIAGIRMCQSYNRQYGTNYVSVMPTNLYGQGDNFDLNTGHVLPALLRRFHEAKIRNENKVKVWGTGSPLREFLYVDDLADALIFVMKNYDKKEIINIGVGKGISIRDLAVLIKDIVGFRGRIEFDPKKPDGTPLKVLDVTKMSSLGWDSNTLLKDGIKRTYEWYSGNN